jgi:ParB family chromosome partitioning protein
MFSQGKRNDIIDQIKMLEKPNEYKGNATSSQVAKKLTTIEKVGEKYSLSKDTVARYLRIQQLIQALKTRLDDGSIAFIPAVTLSFLKEEEQVLVDDCMECNGLSVDMKKAGTLRRLSESGKLNGESVKQVLSGGTKPKVGNVPTVKINKDLYAKYFKPNQPSKEVQEVVEKALVMYFNRN